MILRRNNIANAMHLPCSSRMVSWPMPAQFLGSEVRKRTPPSDRVRDHHRPTQMFTPPPLPTREISRVVSTFFLLRIRRLIT